jgi:hypothetical protein
MGGAPSTPIATFIIPTNNTVIHTNANNANAISYPLSTPSSTTVATVAAVTTVTGRRNGVTEEDVMIHQHFDDSAQLSECRSDSVLRPSSSSANGRPAGSSSTYGSNGASSTTTTNEAQEDAAIAAAHRAKSRVATSTSARECCASQALRVRRLERLSRSQHDRIRALEQLTARYRRSSLPVIHASNR